MKSPTATIRSATPNAARVSAAAGARTAIRVAVPFAAGGDSGAPPQAAQPKARSAAPKSPAPAFAHPSRRRRPSELRIQSDRESRPRCGEAGGLIVLLAE